MLNVQEIEVESLKPWNNNPRLNEHAVDAVARSIRSFGFNVPILCDQNMVIVAGHTRWKAAKQLGLRCVPVIQLGMTDIQRRAFAVADNKTGELAEWSLPRLRDVLEELRSEDIDLGTIGFSGEDLRRLLEGPLCCEDDIPAIPEEPRTRTGDLVQIGRHRLLCGDSTRQDHIDLIVGGNKVDIVFAGPPCFNQKMYAQWEALLVFRDPTGRMPKMTREGSRYMAN